MRLPEAKRKFIETRCWQAADRIIKEAIDSLERYRDGNPDLNRELNDAIETYRQVLVEPNITRKRQVAEQLVDTL